MAKGKYRFLRCKYKDYLLKFDMVREEGVWKSTVENYHNDERDSIVFENRNRKQCQGKMISWFHSCVDDGSVQQFVQDGYDIEPVFEDVLLSVRDIPVGYHVTEKENKLSVEQLGLYPRGNEDKDVSQASHYMDQVKPSFIPEWVNRYDAVYSYTEITNYFLSSSHANRLLYAFPLVPERCWVGSIGLGGFCLFDDVYDSEPEFRKEHIHKVLTDYGVLYWKNSCSLQDFIENGKRVQRKDKNYGLDEILIFHELPPSSLVLIGEWDENGKFIEYEAFKNFVKQKFKTNYREILSKYPPDFS